VVMNHGNIEQVGPPQELYHHPRTRFVAGFIGSPSMNFMPAKLEGNGAALTLHLADGIKLPIPAARTARYAPHAGRDVLFGIRPEHLTETRQTEHRANIAVFEAAPEVVEPMGMETLLHFWMQGHEICARFDPAVEVSPGQRVPMAVDMDQMHLIDPKTDLVL
ncbi:MAG: TOBE domain-containing protein, partial [Acetobacteraceae bacterium]